MTRRVSRARDTTADRIRADFPEADGRQSNPPDMGQEGVISSVPDPVKPWKRTMTLPTTTLRTTRHRTTALRTMAIGAALGTALAAAVGTAAPAAPANGGSPQVRTRVLPASAAWSVPVEILESGAVVGNDADTGTLYGGNDIRLSGNTHPWVFSSRGRRDLGVAGRPSGTVVDVAETGVSVGWLTEVAGLGTRRLAARWDTAGAPSLLLPEITQDTAAQDVNLRGDALVDVAGADPDVGAPSSRTRWPTPGASTRAARRSTRRTTRAATWVPATGAPAYARRCRRVASGSRSA
jgi:hypothetical protein